MAIALVWHGFQGWVLQNGYPYNTFLFIPDISYTDFLNARDVALRANPYLDRAEGYLPASYAIFFRVFSWFRPVDSFLLFMIVGVCVPLLVSIYVLHPIAGERLLALRARAMKRALQSSSKPMLKKSWLAASQRLPKVDFPRIYVLSLFYGLAFLYLSYPMWMVIDRANNEIYIALFLGLSLVFISQCRYGIGLAWLLPGICFKMYPAVLLVLFLRRGKLRWIVLAAAGFLLITWGSYASFSGPISKDLELEQQAISIVYDKFIIGNWGMGGSATPWNGWKFILEWVNYQGDGSPQSIEINRISLIPVFKSQLVVFNVCCMLGAVAVTLYACFVEKEFLRRVVVLLLYLVMAGPYGGEYKLLHVITALMAMLLLRTRRPCDLAIIVLLAFTLIPKKEMLLPFAGVTDGGAKDVSVAILLNPLAMLTVIALLVRDSFRQWNLSWSTKRFQILLSSFQVSWLRRSSSSSEAHLQTKK